MGREERLQALREPTFVLDWLLDVVFAKDPVQFQTIRGQAPPSIGAPRPIAEASPAELVAPGASS